ncbi:hypothetical protein HZH68_009768 [Vespula germanica]|uniref:Uncharacterized protein n=1 Tax=Vespula germanica TaxID=30212 RepID=A0A834N645_VESGE|nr:hypothetical protein HZH68_009768 [Vespula germanica]
MMHGDYHKRSTLHFTAAECRDRYQRLQVFWQELYVVIPEKIKPLEEKIRVVLEYFKSRTIVELCWLLEMANYYRRCLK